MVVGTALNVKEKPMRENTEKLLSVLVIIGIPMKQAEKMASTLSESETIGALKEVQAVAKKRIAKAKERDTVKVNIS